MPRAAGGFIRDHCLAFLFAFGLPSLVALAGDGDWSSFQSGGSSAVQASVATKWAAGKPFAWESETFGYGQSTPVILASTVYVTSTSGDNKEQYHVSALELSTGKLKWRKDFSNPTPEKNSTYVSRAAPTPVVDEAGVYAFFEGGLLVALDPAGEQRWKRDLVSEFGAISARHGIASSLEHDSDQLFVWVERSEEPYLMAVSKSTGSENWKVPGLGSTTWSTPRLTPVDDSAKHLVCSASGKIVGFDPESGRRLWEFDQISGNTSCTPFPVGNGRFLIGASDGRGEENAGKGAASNGIIQIAKNDSGDWSAEFQWQAKKATSSFGSPIASADSAFIVNRVGVLYRLDLETGKAAPPMRLKCGGIWATPLIAGGKLYLFGSKGTTSVVDLATNEEEIANTTWEVEAWEEGEERSFGGSVLYAGVVAGDTLILRRGDRVYAVAAN
ncbi:MAG: PQQ-binding-like beta-propeller repeat protein [Planctomycetota bacterium]